MLQRICVNQIFPNSVMNDLYCYIKCFWYSMANGLITLWSLEWWIPRLVRLQIFPQLLPGCKLPKTFRQMATARQVLLLPSLLSFFVSQLPPVVMSPLQYLSFQGEFQTPDLASTTKLLVWVLHFLFMMISGPFLEVKPSVRQLLTRLLWFSPVGQLLLEPTPLLLFLVGPLSLPYYVQLLALRLIVVASFVEPLRLHSKISFLPFFLVLTPQLPLMLPS